MSIIIQKYNNFLAFSFLLLVSWKFLLIAQSILISSHPTPIFTSTNHHTIIMFLLAVTLLCWIFSCYCLMPMVSFHSKLQPTFSCIFENSAQTSFWQIIDKSKRERLALQIFMRGWSNMEVQAVSLLQWCLNYRCKRRMNASCS